MILGTLISVVLGIFIGVLLKDPAGIVERLARRLWRVKPLAVHVETDRSWIWYGTPDWVPFSVYFRKLDHLSSPPDSRQDWLEWADNQGGLDVHTTYLSITLQATIDTTVVVDGVRVQRRRSEVESGYVVTRSTGGADMTPRRFEITLDWGDDPLVLFRDAGGETSDYSAVKLSSGDVERFQVWATAEYDRHDWTLELMLIIDGRRVVHPVDNNGAEFTTIGPSGVPAVDSKSMDV